HRPLHVGGVAAAHQIFSGLGPPLAGEEGAAAVLVGATTARATPGHARSVPRRRRDRSTHLLARPPPPCCNRRATWLYRQDCHERPEAPRAHAERMATAVGRRLSLQPRPDPRRRAAAADDGLPLHRLP